MVEAHFQGSKLLHVVADDEGMASLREKVRPAEGFVTNVFELGRYGQVPIFPPGVCGCDAEQSDGPEEQV